MIPDDEIGVMSGRTVVSGHGFSVYSELSFRTSAFLAFGCKRLNFLKRSMHFSVYVVAFCFRREPIDQPSWTILYLVSLNMLLWSFFDIFVAAVSSSSRREWACYY